MWLLPPRLNPLPTDTSLLYSSALKRAVSGVARRMRFMLTMPLVRLPYSADGMPRTISTLSMLSVDMVRISTPLLVMSRLASGEVVSVVPGMCCMLASPLMGAPSTMNSVPSELME